MAFASVTKIKAGSQPIPPPTAAGSPLYTKACAVLVSASPPANGPYESCFNIILYLDVAAGPTQVNVPQADTILLADLPDGVTTPFAEIAAAITKGNYGQVSAAIGPLQPPINGDFASVQAVLPPNTNSVIVTPSVDEGALGSLVVVQATPPTGSNYGTKFYDVLAYVGSAVSGTKIKLVSTESYAVVDLPNGVNTSSSELQAALETGGGGNPPGGVGPTHP